MTTPTLTVRVDWANTGTFGSTPYDTVHPIAFSRTVGASGDFSEEAIGSLDFTLDNENNAYTPDRNWADNPSFEVGTEGWSTVAITGLTAAATSITQVTDNAPDAGTKAGEAVLTATSGSGVTYAIPYRFRDGMAYSFTIYLKSMSGTTSVQCGLASSGTPADIGTAAGTITGSWAAYSGTFTPTEDRTDVVVFVRTTTASTATVRIDRIQVNPGAASNAYLEAPTKGQLVPGRPVHVHATYGGTDYPKFFGYLEQLVPSPESFTVAFTCYDHLRRLAETDIVVPANEYTERSARSMRLAVLEDFERGTRNLVGHNPSFETNTTGWAVSAGTLTRTTTDAAPGAGSAYGSFASGATDRYAYIYPRLAPLFFEGEVYRFSVYLKDASGPRTWKIGLGETPGTGTERSVTVTTAWQRFTLTHTMTADQTQIGGNPLVAWVKSTLSGTVRIDAAMVTRGQALHPYSDTGTGRWPNWVGNGDFEGGGPIALSLAGWRDAFANLVGNPSFESNTTGWSTAGDAFVGSSTSFTRATGDGQYGSACAELSTIGPNRGAFYAITGTFEAGVTYDFGVWTRDTAGTFSAAAGIGSQGTPADFNESVNLSVGTGWLGLAGSWTPSSNRTDVHFWVEDRSGGTSRWDAAYVFRRDFLEDTSPTYVDQGPGSGAGTYVSSALVILAGDGAYGYRSHMPTTRAAAGSGRLYDFGHVGAYFVAGQQYTASIWVKPSSNMAYRVGFSADKGDGTYDESTPTTGTATANVWTQITNSWTPSADRSATRPYEVVLTIWQTDTSSRTLRIDGARVIPGASADDFEEDHWDISVNGAAGEAGDLYSATASLSGSALSALSQINALTLSRHWIRPTMAAPWYEYVTEDRVTFAAKSSSETFSGDVQVMEAFDIDRAAILNVVPISHAGGLGHYSDADSVEAYGVRLSATINGAAFFPDLTIPDVLGAAFIAKYKDPRARPVVQLTNYFPEQLSLELNDVITISVPRYLVTSEEFVILREDLTVDQAGLEWITTYQLETFTY